MCECVCVCVCVSAYSDSVVLCMMTALPQQHQPRLECVDYCCGTGMHLGKRPVLVRVGKPAEEHSKETTTLVLNQYFTYNSNRFTEFFRN